MEWRKKSSDLDSYNHGWESNGELSQNNFSIAKLKLSKPFTGNLLQPFSLVLSRAFKNHVIIEMIRRYNF